MKTMNKLKCYGVGCKCNKKQLHMIDIPRWSLVIIIKTIIIIKKTSCESPFFVLK